ncbi:MAG: hypothetical protein M0Z46_02680 [Actinomycetota bacterium]|nr:hypothetical protein [Actinomycetota bacterium]
MRSGTPHEAPQASASAGEARGQLPPLLEGRLPPVALLVVSSLALMLSGGVYLAAHLPHPPPLTPAIGLLAGGGALTVAAVVLVARIRLFAWATFFAVARWALLGYAAISGLLAFVFVDDGTRASTLAVLVPTLVVFAVDVPLVIAFTAASCDVVGGTGADR